MTRNKWSLPVGLLFLGVWACASSSARTSGACRSQSWRSGGPLADVVDSAAFIGRFDSLSTQRLGLVVATVAYDSVGAMQDVVVQSRSALSTTLQAMREALRAMAPPSSDPDSRFYLVLSDDAGLRPRRVDRLRGCAPAFRDKGRLASMLEREAALLGIDRLVTIHVLAHVREDGTVDEARVDRSSGSPTIDQAATRVVQHAAFVPALVEGIPVAVWASFPISFKPTR